MGEKRPNFDDITFYFVSIFLKYFHLDLSKYDSEIIL